MYSKILIVCLTIASALAFPQRTFRGVRLVEPNYQVVEVARPKVVRVLPVRKTEEIVEAPRPYDMSYTVTDEYGNTQGRQESGDAHGNKQGSYSQRDVNGLFRQVSYVADDGGARFIVETNEPGTSNDSPADVEMTANPVEVVRTQVKPKEVRRVVLVKEPIRYY